MGGNGEMIDGLVRLVVRALKEAEGDEREACALVRRWLAADPTLRDRVLTPLLAAVQPDTARNAANAATHGTKSLKPSNGPRPLARKDDTDGLALVAAMRARSLLEFRVGPNLMLGEASRAQVVYAARLHKALGQFLARVALGMGDAPSVGDVFTHDDLVRLLRKAGIRRTIPLREVEDGGDHRRPVNREKPVAGG
jgi:hypothetical protein